MRDQMHVHSGPMLAPRPPLAAYREDLARRRDGTPFGPSDATWLSVATILSHAVDVPADARPPLPAALREVLGTDPALHGVVAAHDHAPSGPFELDAVTPIVRAVVERMEDAGALSLAYSTLAILDDADLPLSVLERGRVLAQLGRVAWKTGAIETAREQYRRVEVLGRAARNAELRTRAWIGYGIVATLRGNYPEARKWATRAAHEAERGTLPALASLAYYSLMLSSGVAGDFNGSLVYGWHAFRSAHGDEAREAEMLVNLSQLLLESGHPEAAGHGFSAALARHPGPRVALPALGGLARAAAALQDDRRVRAAWAGAQHLLEDGSLPYQRAAALLEFSQALDRAGEPRLAADCRAQGLAIAESHGYHEITHRLEATRLQAAAGPKGPLPLDANGAEVVRAVSLLDPIGAGAGANLHGS